MTEPMAHARAHTHTHTHTQQLICIAVRQHNIVKQLLSKNKNLKKKLKKLNSIFSSHKKQYH